RRIGVAWRESKGCGRSSEASATPRSAKTSRSWRPRFKCTSPAASLGNGPSWNSWRSGSGGRPRARVDVLERSWSSGCSAHPATHGGQPVHHAVRSFDEVPMESRVRGFDERIADDLWRLSDPRESIISKGEPEAESRDRMASNAREPVADELAVRDVFPPKVFHRPPQRPAYSFERRSDFGAAVSVHPSSGNRCSP